MQLNVRVVPNAKRFNVKVTGEEIKIYLTEQPENGKANAELVKNLAKLLDTPVLLIRGQKSRRKVIEVSKNEEEIWKILRNRSE
ncbi:MAG: DUF167 domain-containing protein [Candidatus Micrarchaeota archaeon]|nr:DUF167 domain-containing protein [Candidatus Micrarchaeota archaeon]